VSGCSSSSLKDASDELHRLRTGFDDRLESPVTLSRVSLDMVTWLLFDSALMNLPGRGGGRDGGNNEVTSTLDGGDSCLIGDGCLC
jgi:hypothetical protein